MFKKLLFIALVIPTLANAQSDYTFTVSTATYEDLTDATVILNSEWDDPTAEFSLGFDFQVGAIVSNSLFINDLSLGGVVTNASSDLVIQSLVAPIATDLISREDVNGNFSSPVSLKVEGDAGSRIVKMEWKNAGFFDDDTEADFINFQLWLYEEDSAIEYHYGPSSVNNIAGSYEGIGGPIVALVTGFDGNTEELTDTAYLLSGSPTAPVVNTFGAGENTGDDAIAIEGTIPDGTVYRFADASLSIENVVNTLTVQAYPNPTADYLTINTNTATFSADVYSTTGQLVLKKTDAVDGIDMSSLKAGIYFLNVTTSLGASQQKIIKL